MTDDELNRVPVEGAHLHAICSMALFRLEQLMASYKDGDQQSVHLVKGLTAHSSPPEYLIGFCEHVLSADTGDVQARITRKQLVAIFTIAQSLFTELEQDCRADVANAHCLTQKFVDNGCHPRDALATCERMLDALKGSEEWVGVFCGKRQLDGQGPS